MSDLPQHITELQQLLETTPPKITSPIARWFGLPGDDECPTPGEAKSWRVEEWKQWAEAHGYAYKDEAKHGFVWQHTLSPRLLVSVAKTPSDFRSGMAMATEVRRMVRCVSDDISVVIRVALPKATEKTGEEAITSAFFESRERLINEVMKLVNDINAINITRQKIKLSSEGDLTNGVEVWKILEMIQKEFDISPRTALLDSMPAESRNNPELWEAYKAVVEQVIERRKWPETVGVDPEVVTCLRDYVELQREYRKLERDQRREAREARENKTKREPTIHERLEAAVADQRREIFTQADNLMKTVAKAMEQARHLANNCPKLHLPAFEDPQHLQERLQAAQEEMTATRGLQSTQEAEIANLRAEITRLGAEAAKGRENPAAETLRDFAKQIQTIIAETDFSNLAVNLKRIKSEAIAAEAMANEMMAAPQPKQEAAHV